MPGNKKWDGIPFWVGSEPVNFGGKGFLALLMIIGIMIMRVRVMIKMLMRVKS